MLPTDTKNPWHLFALEFSFPMKKVFEMKMQRYQPILVKPNYSVHLVLNSLLLHLQLLHSFHPILVTLWIASSSCSPAGKSALFIGLVPMPEPAGHSVE